VLMLDETILTETPPLRCCYGRIGRQVCIPSTGTRAKRILHGVLNVTTGDLLLLITEVWDEVTHQYFLAMIRAHWRGWRIVLFEDRGTPHTAEGSQEVARDLGLQIRWLPRATPALNAMDHLWRHVKGRAVADRPTRTIEESAAAACRYLLEMSCHERLQKAGVLSGHFWLTS
jgi:transposase